MALYLLAHVAFKRRAAGQWSVPRIVAALVLVGLIPLWGSVDALVALAGVTGLVALLIAYESVRFAEVRAEERHHLHEHHPGDGAPA